MKTLIALAIILACVSSALAAFATWTQSVAPNGMNSYLFTITSSSGGLIQGVDLSGQWGFKWTAMNNPQPFGATLPSIFQDDVPQGVWDFAGWNPLNDSMFLLNRADVLVIPGTDTESSTSLQATFGIPGPKQAPSFQVRIVAPAGASPAGWMGDTLLKIGEIGVNGASEDVFIEPEPATMALLAFGGLAVLRRRCCRTKEQGR